MYTQISAPENKQGGHGLSLLTGPHWNSEESENSAYEPDLPSYYGGRFFKARK